MKTIPFFVFIILSAPALWADLSICPSRWDHWDQKSKSANTSQLLRSNVPHYWAWLAKHKDLLGPFQQYDGWVAGDPHLNNFGVLLTDKIPRFSVVDIDDTGFGNYMGDLARLILLAEEGAHLKKLTLVEAYFEGLKGFDMNVSVPKSVRKNLETTRKEQSERNEEKLKDSDWIDSNGKIVRNDERFDAEGKMKDGPTEFEISDIVEVKRARQGCSACSHYFVLTDKLQRQPVLLDLKEITTPGTACYQPGQSILNFTDELDRTMRLIRDHWGLAGSKLVGTVTMGGKNFLMKPKQWIKNDEDENENEKILIYEARYLGHFHREMNKNEYKNINAYIAAIENLSVVEFKELIETLLQKYRKTLPEKFRKG